MKLIQHKSYGPVAALKRESRKQMLVMGIMPFIIFGTNINHIDSVFTSVLFWSYILLCIGVIAFGYFNYRLASKMEIMDNAVKTNLDQYINTMEKMLQWKLIGLRITFIFFVVLIEILPYFQHFRMLNTWNSLPIAVRFGTYYAFFIMQYFLSASVNKRKYGTHLEYLKKLVSEMV